MAADRVVLASSNRGKLRELQKILHQENIALLPQSEYGVTDAEETGLSFVENAIIKARHACEMTGRSSDRSAGCRHRSRGPAPGYRVQSIAE